MRNLYTALFAVLAVSNFLKPLRLGGAQTGFVLFGERLAGTANTVAGPLFGLYLLLYATAIWRRDPIALPLGIAYAVYVVANLVLYTARNPRPPGAGYLVFMVVYAAVAIGVSAGAVALLARERAALR
jgi:hypothetical protein